MYNKYVLVMLENYFEKIVIIFKHLWWKAYYIDNGSVIEKFSYKFRNFEYHPCFVYIGKTDFFRVDYFVII